MEQPNEAGSGIYRGLVTLVDEHGTVVGEVVAHLWRARAGGGKPERWGGSLRGVADYESAIRAPVRLRLAQGGEGLAAVSAWVVGSRTARIMGIGSPPF